METGDSDGERVDQLDENKENDQRAGSPAGHRVTATMISSGGEVSEIGERRT